LWFTSAPGGRVIHSLPVALQLRPFGWNGLSFLLPQPFGQDTQIV
jgi:hypothetical protein